MCIENIKKNLGVFFSNWFFFSVKPCNCKPFCWVIVKLWSLTEIFLNHEAEWKTSVCVHWVWRSALPYVCLDVVTNSQGEICWAVLLKAGWGNLIELTSSFVFPHSSSPSSSSCPSPFSFSPPPSLSSHSVLAKFHHPGPSRLLHKQVCGFPGWQLSSVLSSTSHCTPSCFCDHFSLTGNGIRGSALLAVCSNYSLSRLSSCFQAWVSQSPRVFWQWEPWKVCSLS